MRLSTQQLGNFHEIVNLSVILILELLAGFSLWQFISPWWLWTLSFIPAFWLISFVSHRFVPTITSPFIQLIVSPDTTDELGATGTRISDKRKPVDQKELLGVVLGLVVFGYPTVDSFFTDSMLGFWRDGFFRVYQAEEPISFWIYRTLSMAGTLVCIWGVAYLLTEDRERTDEDTNMDSPDGQ